MKKPVIIKKNGKLQRSDVGLNKEVVSSLVQKIFSGETLFPPNRRLELTLGEGEDQRTVEISANTVNNWIKRNNVIPETGMTLREVLDEARLKYRTKEREERAKNMVYEAEKAVERTIRLRTNTPVIGMFGIMKDQNGKIIRKENTQLLKIKMDTAQFLLERLNPEKYGKVEKTENKHLVFSLSDLRKAKEARDANVPPQTNG